MYLYSMLSLYMCISIYMPQSWRWVGRKTKQWTPPHWSHRHSRNVLFMNLKECWFNLPSIAFFIIIIAVVVVRIQLSIEVSHSMKIFTWNAKTYTWKTIFCLKFYCVRGGFIHLNPVKFACCASSSCSCSYIRIVTNKSQIEWETYTHK